jgi:hypothetical protein
MFVFVYGSNLIIAKLLGWSATCIIGALTQIQQDFRSKFQASSVDAINAGW